MDCSSYTIIALLFGGGFFWLAKKGTDNQVIHAVIFFGGGFFLLQSITEVCK